MLIGLIGPAGSGKTTVARILSDQYGFKRLRFTDPLKRMLGPSGLGLSFEEINGSKKDEPSAFLNGITPRHAMQTLGTEWGRMQMFPNFWIHCWIQDFMRIPNSIHVVADDVRFDNEVDTIKKRGGIIVKIIGRSAGIGDDHASEKAPLCEVIYLDNSYGMEFLAEQVEGLIAGFRADGEEL